MGDHDQIGREGFGSEPGEEGLDTPPNILNTWTGFSSKAIKGDWALFQNHLLDAVCSGRQQHFEWLVKWMAFTVQFPWKPIQSAVVLTGGQGTGKGTFTEEFGRLFGRYFRIIANSRHITGDFNQELHECLVANLNESVYTGSKHETEVLKGLITDPKILINPKGVGKFSADNRLHVIITTNNDFAIKAEADDRRFFVLRMNEKYKGNHGYFNAIRWQMDHGGREAMLHDLMNMDLTDYNPRQVPITEELMEQKAYALDSFAKILDDILSEGEMPGGQKHASGKASDSPLDIVRVSPSGLRDWFNAKKDSFDRKLDQRSLAAGLYKLLGIKAKRNCDWRFYEFPPLNECRARFVMATGIKGDWAPAPPNEYFIGIRSDNTGWKVVPNNFTSGPITESSQDSI